MAGIAPEEVDTAQLYDCFTYMVLVQLEITASAPRRGRSFVQSARFARRASSTNTSGGQLSEPCRGMLQIVEGVRQLRRDYHPSAKSRRGNRPHLRPWRQSGLPLHADPGAGLMAEPVHKPCRTLRRNRSVLEGAGAKKLMLPRCNICGRFWFPPSQRCRHCLSADFAWRESRGEGRIYSFVVYHRVFIPVSRTTCRMSSRS